MRKIWNKQIYKYRKEFQKDLQAGKKVIIIPNAVVQEFEQQCTEDAKKWASEFFHWRALSANSNITF